MEIEKSSATYFLAKNHNYNVCWHYIRFTDKPIKDKKLLLKSQQYLTLIAQKKGSRNAAMEVTLQVTSVLVGIIKTQMEIQCPSIHLQRSSQNKDKQDFNALMWHKHLIQLKMPFRFSLKNRFTPIPLFYTGLQLLLCLL